MTAVERTAGSLDARGLIPQPLMQRYGPKIVARCRVAQLSELLPAGYQVSGLTVDQAMKAVTEALDEYLSEGEVYWKSSATSLGICYPSLKADALELKHNTLLGVLRRTVREVLPDQVAQQGPTSYKILGPDEFLRSCERLRVRPEQVQKLDLAALLLRGEPGHLPRRIKPVIAEVLDEYLRSRDLMTQPSEQEIVFAFPHLQGSLAKLKCDQIAAEIATRLRVPEHEVAEADPYVPSKAAQAARPRRPAGELVAERQPASRPPSAPAADPAEIALWNQALVAMASASEAGLRGFDAASVAERCSTVLVPLWNVPAQKLVGLNLQAMAKNGATSRSILAAPDEVDATADLSALVLAVEMLRRTSRTRAEGIVMVPVSFHTLERERYRRLYLEICSGLDERQKKFLVLELNSVPQDLARFRLEERVSQMRARARAVFARLSGNDTPARWRGTGVHAVGADLDEVSLSEGALLPFLEKLAARAAWMNVYALGIRSKSAAVAAVASGYAYLTGPAVAGPMPEPHGVEPFTNADMFIDPGE